MLRDGQGVLSYDDAKMAATVRGVTEDMPIAQAVGEWRDWKINGTDNPTRQRDLRTEAARIAEPFGRTTLQQVTARLIIGWHESFLDGYDDPEARRKRRATANRALNNLKAALNRACDHYGIPAGAWVSVKRFSKDEAFGKRVIVLTDEEERRLIAAAEDDGSKSLIRAAFLTGCRYGELITATDLNGRRLRVRGKTGERSVVLSPAGAEFFAGLGDSPLLLRADDRADVCEFPAGSARGLVLVPGLERHTL
jgi:integrase